MVIAIGPGNNMVEVFIKSPKLNVKKSASTIEREWMAGRLAKALGLPCAYPLQVHVPPELAEFAGDIELAEQLAAGPEVLFGSLRAPAGYAMWSDGTNLPVAYAPVAAQAYLLDCVLQNWDRSISNPNVMTNGSAIFLFDHDEAFAYATDTDLAAVAAAKLPWTKGGIENYYEGTTQHVLWRIYKSTEMLTSSRCLPLGKRYQKTHTILMLTPCRLVGICRRDWR